MLLACPSGIQLVHAFAGTNDVCFHKMAACGRSSENRKSVCDSDPPKDHNEAKRARSRESEEWVDRWTLQAMTSGNTQAAKAHQKIKGKIEFPEKGKGGLAY